MICTHIVTCSKEKLVNLLSESVVRKTAVLLGNEKALAEYLVGRGGVPSVETLICPLRIPIKPLQMFVSKDA